MYQENRYAALLAPSTSHDDIKDPSKRSRISYTRSFLLSLAKAGDHRTKLKILREIQIAMSCAFENSPGLLPSPYCEQDSACQKVRPQDSASKALDTGNLLHKSDEPYLPPCRNKALSSSTGNSNGSPNGDISGSSECTNQEQAEPEKCGNVSYRKLAKMDNLWESCKKKRFAPVIPDVQIEQESELKSSNMSLEDCSTFIPGLCLPDEDSLIAYDGPFLNHEVETPPGIDSFKSAPESNLIEDDLDSSCPTFIMIKDLVESVLDESHDGYYRNDSMFECQRRGAFMMDPIMAEEPVQHGASCDESLMNHIMAELVQLGARLGHFHLSYPRLFSKKLNPGKDQQDHNCYLRSSTDPPVFSLFSHPCHKIYETFPTGYDQGDELKRFGLGAGESMFQQGIMPSQLPAFDEVPSHSRGDGDGDGDGDIDQAVVNSLENMKF